MDRNEECRNLAKHFSQMLGLGTVIDIQEASMDAYDKGYSGAELFRMECSLEHGKEPALSAKKQTARNG